MMKEQDSGGQKMEISVALKFMKIIGGREAKLQKSFKGKKYEKRSY